jgi:ADP-heptose:LPS heptosyltransferase
MVSGIARRLHEKEPTRKVMILDKYAAPREHPLWLGNPHIASTSARKEDCQTIINAPGLRPYHVSKDTRRFTFQLDYRPDIGEIFLTDAEREFASQHRPQIVIQPKVKAKASQNKDWGGGHWVEFIKLAKKAGYEVVELGPQGLNSFVRVIRTDTFRLACAVLANAKAYVGHESGLHHAAAALGIPGVVIFGGYTPVELTGYPMHRNLGASLGDACGMRVPCPHCEKWMASITPEQVFKELQEVLHG